VKILFVGSRESDYLQDLTFSGIVKRLGRHRVIEDKVFWRYHLPIKQYPRNLGYAGMAMPSRSWRAFAECDYVLVGAAKPDCFRRYQAILDAIPANVRTVFVDGGDRPEVGGDLDRLQAHGLFKEVTSRRPFDVVFKREYLVNVQYGPNVYPLPMSFDFSKVKMAYGVERMRWEVAFWAVESDTIRSRAFELLDGHFDCAENGTCRGQKFKNYARKGRGYLDEARRCKIHLNFRGVGWDTLRYWEIPALGRFMISQKPGIVIPDDFEPEKEIVHCADDLADLNEKCRYYLAHDDERERIASRGFMKSLRCHSDIARADYLLGVLSGRVHFSAGYSGIP